MTVLYSARFIFLTSYLTNRGSVNGATRINATFLIIRILGLFFIRNVSGKFLFLELASFKRIPSLRLTAKFVTISALLGAGLFYHINYYSLKTSLKFYRFIWGLPIVAAGMLIKPMKSLGVKLSKSLSFSLLDHLLFGNAVAIGSVGRVLRTQTLLAPQKIIRGAAFLGARIYLLIRI